MIMRPIDQLPATRTRPSGSRFAVEWYMRALVAAFWTSKSPVRGSNTTGSRHGWVASPQPAVPFMAPLMINTLPFGRRTMSPMTRRLGIVNIDHWGFSSTSSPLLTVIDPQVSEAGIRSLSSEYCAFGSVPPQISTVALASLSPLATRRINFKLMSFSHLDRACKPQVSSSFPLACH